MKKTTFSLLFLSLSLLLSAQTVDNKPLTNDSIYVFCDKNPEYQDSLNGLVKFIADSLIYPDNALMQNIQGKVVVRLTVEKDGTIEEMELLGNPDYRLAEEAVRVLSLTSGKWAAGEKGGEKVRSYFTIPVAFRIKEEPIYKKLKSDNPAVCPEKQAEFIGGANEFQNFISNNLFNFTTDTRKDVKSKIVVRVVAEKRNKKQLNNMRDIQKLDLEMNDIDYVTKGEIRSSTLTTINSSGLSRNTPAVIVANKVLKGNTLVSFVIEKNGMVSNVKIVETYCDNNNPNVQFIQELEKEIMRVFYLSAEKWIPAEMNCEKIRMNVTLPIIWEHITRPKIT